MRRMLEARLAKLEAARGTKAHTGQAHRIIVWRGDDADAQIDALVASGAASRSDRFIVRRIIGEAA